MTGDRLVEIQPASMPGPPAIVPSGVSEAARLQRIREIHGCPNNDGDCLECFRPHPCVTYRLAAGL